MRVLVACEFSGVVRRAFRERGHDAWSCDILPAEDGSPFHLQGNVKSWLEGRANLRWDLMIAHPPCTHLAVSGSRWFKDKRVQQEEALDFVRLLLNAPPPRIALENPVSVISSRIRRPDQIKATCLWLKGLPKLQPTHADPDLFEPRRPAPPAERRPRVHREPPSLERWKNRSRTMTGIASAMAEQWGWLEKASGKEQEAV